jgi:hypothetical protein
MKKQTGLFLSKCSLDAVGHFRVTGLTVTSPKIHDAVTLKEQLQVLFPRFHFIGLFLPANGLTENEYCNRSVIFKTFGY